MVHPHLVPPIASTTRVTFCSVEYSRWFSSDIRTQLQDSAADADGERVLCVLAEGGYQVARRISAALVASYVKNKRTDCFIFCVSQLKADPEFINFP